MKIKDAIKSNAFARSIYRRLGRFLSNAQTAPGSFDNSADYWERRYRSGGNSGAGSYGQLATFKADFLNGFVAKHGVRSVIEFGSGDGNQLELASYPSYTGIDVSSTVVEHAREKFAAAPNILFIHTSEVTDHLKSDLTISLDVIYHLVEDKTFNAYMNDLFNASLSYVIIYASNDERPSPVPHVRHRKFTDWVMEHRPDFVLVEHVPNAYPFDERDQRNTSFADFFIFKRK